MTAITDPFVAPAPSEVPLRNAPLARVIAQVRFPLVIAVEKREFVAPFQQAVQARYPVLRQEQAQAFVFGPGGPGIAQQQTAWRFTDVAGLWRLSLTPEFLAIETSAYESRSDFLARLGEALGALEQCVAPKLVDRLGLRYIDRLTGPAVDGIAQLMRPEVCGIAGTPLAEHMVHSFSESMFTLGSAQLLARWGRLGPRESFDPSSIDPMDEGSWILDFDMSSTSPQPFTVQGVVNEARDFAERIYALFRWAVLPEFLRRYGGDV